MSTATYRTRTRPQHFQSSPAIDGRSPLTRLIDEISERFEHSIGRPKLAAVGEERDPMKWRKAKDINLHRQNARMERQRHMRKRYAR